MKVGAELISPLGPPQASVYYLTATSGHLPQG